MSLFPKRHYYVLLFCPSHKWLTLNDNLPVSSSVLFCCTHAFRYIAIKHLTAIIISKDMD